MRKAKHIWRERLTLCWVICIAVLSACATPPEPAVDDISKEQTTPISVDSAPEPPEAEPQIFTPPEIIPNDNDTVSAPPKRYAPLIYGAPKPLICSREFPAEKALKTRPNLQIMWENYLYDSPKGVWAEVGGAVEINGCLPEDKGGWVNACTVRLSHMLNKAGNKIPHIKGQTVSGRDGAQYFYRLDDVQTYLENIFGPPDVDIDDATGRWIDIPNAPGLLIMKFPGEGFTGHTTVWNGAGTVDDVDIVGFRILYWKLPCFIPPERKVAMSVNP